MSILSSVLVSAGQGLIGKMGESHSSPKLDRSTQLERFDQRLEHALNPEKARFNEFLSEHHVDDVNRALSFRDELKSRLLSQAELNGFVSANGGYDAQFSIDKSASGYSLIGSNGQSYAVESGSEMESLVESVFHLESVLQLAAVSPGLTLNHLVDQAFEEDKNQPSRKQLVR